MVKLFLVEDEIVMRDGIKQQINWEKEDIEFVGEASDGELAWPMILETKPDILLTDIKMPFMDGLELSALVRKELPDTSIIILSGYDEFTYAQQAVSLGVTDYLLKPLPPGKLLECIRRVQEKIEQERAQSDNVWNEELAREQKDAQKNLLFRALVTNDRSLKEIIAMADHLQIRISARFYAVMLVSVRGKENAFPDEDLRAELAFATEQVPGWIFFDRNENGFAMIGTANSAVDIQDSEKELILSLRKLIEADSENTWFIGVGETVNRISDVEKAFYSANKAMSFRFIEGLNRVVYAQDVCRKDTKETLVDLPAEPEVREQGMNMVPDVSKAVQNDNSRQMLENFLRTGTYEEVEPFIDGVFSSIGENNLHSYVFLTYLSMDMYFAMVRFLKEMGRRADEIDEKLGDINYLLKNQITADQAKVYLTSYLKELIHLRDHNTQKRYGKILREAVRYIDDNYDREDISLNKVAETVGLSQNHFSSIFSQEMGMTFIEYLISRRMEKAKELLRTTQMRSSEVAYRVGYKDPHYFSSTFKKIQGMTPREYRTSCQETG